MVQAPAHALELVLAQLVDAGGFHRVKHGGIGNLHVHEFTRIVFVLQPVFTGLSAWELEYASIHGQT
ncbi:hypothetical protein D3C80_2035130 [compost metagenome]